MCRRFQWAHSMHHDKYRRIVNVEECVKKVREYRMHSVQSLPQFEYIYILMLRHIFLVKVSRVYFDYIEFRWLIVFSAFIKIWEHEEFFFLKHMEAKIFIAIRYFLKTISLCHSYVLYSKWMRFINCIRFSFSLLRWVQEAQNASTMSAKLFSFRKNVATKLF